MKACKEEMFKPLGQDKLQFKSNDGKLKSTQTLGDRLKKFKDLVAAEEKHLEALWKEWTEVHRSMTNLALEMLGPTPDFVGPRRKAAAEEVEKERKKWEDEIAKMSEASLTSMMAGEEVWLEGPPGR